MRCSTLTLAAMLLVPALGAAPPPWIEVRSGHFVVITNSSEKAGRRTAWQFEQIRTALVRVWPWAKIDTGRPFLVVAARDEATLKTLGPQYWEGKRFRPISFSAHGRHKQFVALRTDVQEPDNISANPYQSAYWSYVSVVFSRSFPLQLPEWYRRGMAEVMSNTFVREKELHVGRPLPANLELLRGRVPIPLNEFLSADRRSHWLTQEADIQLFDAQAWAFVHYLMFGEQGAHASKASRFNRLLYDGTAYEVAQKEAFGDMTPYYRGMRDSIGRNLFSYVKLPVSPESRQEEFASRVLSPGEAAVLRGEFLVAMDRPAEARGFAAEATKADATLAGPWEIEAELLDAAGRRDEAKAAFARAVAAGSRSPDAYYRLAQLEWAPAADKATLERLAATLERARELDPESANTLSFLAEIRTSLGQPEEAVALARKAVEGAPAATYHRMALARALWQLGRLDEAITTARAALQTTDSDGGRQQVQAFLEFAARAPRVRPSAGETSGTATSPGPSATAALAPVRVGANAKATGFMASCFQQRDDSACGQAAPLLEAACQGGKPEACRSLGSLYDGGFGVGVDKARAAVAYQRGCQGGDPGSCARLAVLQVQGLGIPRDSAQARSTLQRLCGEKVDDACIGWALILARESGAPKLAKARELLKTTCDRNNDEACRLLKSMPR